MGALVSQAILLASLHVIVGEEASQFIFNLEKTVERYAKDYAKKHGTTVQFFDITASRQELQHRPVYKRHKLTVTATNFQFGEPIGEHYPPTQVYTATFTNGQGSSDTIQTVSQTYTNTESTTTKLVRGFQTNYETSVTIGVPLVTSVGGKYNFEYSLSKTTSEVKTTTETLKIEVKVAVPPKRTVQVTWYVTNKVMPVRFIIHREYENKTENNDIALIKLDTPFNISGSRRMIGTICLTRKPVDYTKTIEVAGWGLLREVDRIVDVVGHFDNIVCQEDDEASAGAECGGVQDLPRQRAAVNKQLGDTGGLQRRQPGLTEQTLRAVIDAGTREFGGVNDLRGLYSTA
ncbi:uncharacterized protein LOC115325931, partial [Ixodes scapularis]|uniref:uncharacterized protein LOC115325931 n=1 Tax=Ixodes scapularis TaxID=6945 RepID=UPI001C382DB7